MNYHFNNVRSIGDAQVTEQLADNLISFLNNGFLNIGAFYNVTHPSSGNFGNSYSTLRPISDSVFEAPRANWIWETDISFQTQPLTLSAYVDGVQTAGVPNFPLGRIDFGTSISPSSVVELDYSYRYVNVYDADTDVFRQIQTNSFRTDSNFSVGSGSWNIDARNRVQLPAIFVDVVPNRSDYPKQIGGGVFIEQDVIFHVVTESTSERRRIMDIIAHQKEKTICLYDKNMVRASGAFPLDVMGNLANNNSYQDLVNNYPWRRMYFKEMRTQDISDYISSIYMGDVRTTVEIDYGVGV